ncbi:CbrC family protein [Iamia majanohamensis]|uniref:CbrC family protein n=1 Tax=Iamia majanohamensis TaxID=467976 RepID=A0AAF0BXQ8_9ACTN|nr:CbrC family protein [Iamia majanohamensis]WCO69233.1 CbrC family protein [Iamia majanohamensis]
MEPLPATRYHPDPLETGSVEPDDVTCIVCDRARGYVYVGPVYADEEYVDEICPWCIADGSAATALGATFTDVDPAPADVPGGVVREVAERTPGFAGWQQEQWQFHCRDAAAYLGTAGIEELAARDGALEMLLHEHDRFGWTAEQSQTFVESLRRAGNPTAHLFRCLHCGLHLAHSDRS